MSIALPVLLLVALVALTRRPEEEPWSWFIDPGLALLCGVGLALLCDRYLVAWHLTGGSWNVTDLHEYCGTVAAMAQGIEDGLSNQRSLLAGLLAAKASPSAGVLGGMALAGVVHLGLTGSGLYLWGRAVHGRAAGILAVLMGASLAPLAAMSHDLRFYPAMTAAFTLGAAGVALALRYRTWPALLLAGVGVGLCFLIDLRGLIWGLCFVGLALVAVAAGPLRALPGKALAFALPLNLAWWLGRWAYGATGSPLEGQVDIFQRLTDQGIRPSFEVHDLPEASYIWGRTPVTGIPDTLRNLMAQNALVPEGFAMHPHHEVTYSNYVEPWVLPVILALALAALACARGSNRLFRLLSLATILPFAVSLQGTLRLGSISLHYLSIAAPGAALALGAGLGGALLLLPGIGRGPTWGRTAGVGLLGLLMVVGVVPSPLAPQAGWRKPSSASNNDLDRVIEMATGERAPDMRNKACVDALTREVHAGGSLERFRSPAKSARPR